MRRLLVPLLLALAACAPAPAKPADAGIPDACLRSFRAVLTAWEATHGRVPDMCAYLDTDYAVELATEGVIPCKAESPGELVVGCTQGRTIYILIDRDPLQQIDTSVHEWTHALANCVDGAPDVGHLRADLWADYGPEAVEAQAQADAFVGQCLPAGIDPIAVLDWLMTAVPAEYRPLLTSAMALLYALGVFLALLRPLLNRIPANSRWRWGVELLDKVLHVFAANSRALSTRIAPAGKNAVPPVVLALVLLFVGCAGSAEQRTRSTLDTLGAVVDPAYSTAMDGCILAERVALEQRNADAFRATSERCHKTQAAFEAIRTLHDRAALLVASGQLEQAQATVKQLLQAWAAMGAGNVANP